MAEPSPDIVGRVSLMSGMAEDARDRGVHFVYVRIPEPLGPFDRGEKYQDPLGEAVARAGLGEVTGGGQQLGEGTILYCGVDVALTDRARGIEFLRRELHRLGAPPETVIEEYLPEFRELPLVAEDA